MKHASADAINQLEPLLVEIRKHQGLVEMKPGIFYRKSKAFLHFHESSEGYFADVRLIGPDFDRMPVNSASEQAQLLSSLSRTLKD